MKRYLAIVFLVCINVMMHAQECPKIIDPVNNAANVLVDATIRWEAIEGVTGYIVSLGTTPGGTDIVDEQANGSSTSIKPPVGLPADTRIYVTITLFFFNRPNIKCESESFTTEQVTVRPGCTKISRPSNGDTNVNVATNITWDYAPKATGYIISIGTSSGGTELVGNLDVGNVLTYNPSNDFSPGTTIYVTVTPYNKNGNAINCSEESFDIGPLATLPDCTRLISPTNGETNVSLSPFVEWESVPGATGYRVFIGKTPTENNILDGGVFTTTSTFVFNFESNNVYFIRIIPFNAAGDAIDCGQDTFSTILGCGPFFNDSTGNLITLNPVISDFPDTFGICSGIGQEIEATDVAQGYRWYRVTQFGESLISELQTISIIEEGDYILELYNFTDNNQIECSTFKEFAVVASESPTINNVGVIEQPNGLNLSVDVSGGGDYEYSIGTSEGPYQDSNLFLNAPFDTEIVYVRDKGGCGIDEFQIFFQSSIKGFPKFFTPNGDGYNDKWQYKAKESDDFRLELIEIFNRYGKLLKSLNPNSSGWDGTIDGLGLPSSDYWYRAKSSDGEIFTGHFTLRR